MLVNLASNQTIGAGATATYQYACNSAQQVYIRCDDDGSDSLDGFLTITIGNDVVCNDISFSGLALVSAATTSGEPLNLDAVFKVDLGSHILDGEENLYVTLRNGDASNTMTAVDVCAIVNEGGVYQPLKYTNYDDKVFTDTNTLAVYAWSASALDDDTSAFTIRNQAYSSTPQVQDGTIVTACNASASSAGNVFWNNIATMAKNQVPMNTSINYSSATIDGVICVSALDRLPSKARASEQAGQAVLRGMTASERKAL
tara:strand:- start:1337 stop:2110 length:774 start_codon:yes stop_codon:yes gene_type:complete